jgi:hypothetical protein
MSIYAGCLHASVHQVAKASQQKAKSANELRLYTLEWYSFSLFFISLELTQTKATA